MRSILYNFAELYIVLRTLRIISQTENDLKSCRGQFIMYYIQFMICYHKKRKRLSVKKKTLFIPFTLETSVRDHIIWIHRLTICKCSLGSRVYDSEKNLHGNKTLHDIMLWNNLLIKHIFFKVIFLLAKIVSLSYKESEKINGKRQQKV